jgi:hypothetical protein
MNNIQSMNDADAKKIKFKERGGDFQDVIKRGEGNLNIIDYLEVNKDFYLVGEQLKAIYDRLKGAIAVVALQKDPHKDLGAGGWLNQQKPILSVSVDYGIATITKFKGEFKGGNPRGRQYRFKIVDGGGLIKVQDWHLPVKEK